MSEEEAMKLDEERFSKTLDALDEIYGVGLEDTAKFLAHQLGVSQWWEPENRA